MQTAIATVSLSGTLNEKLEAIAKAHFRGVEIFENDLLSFNGTPTVHAGKAVKDALNPPTAKASPRKKTSSPKKSAPRK